MLYSNLFPLEICIIFLICSPKILDITCKWVLLYEMLTGFPPFADDDSLGLYEKILIGDVIYPKYIDPIAKDFMRELLVIDKMERLGNLEGGVEDVKNHRWFEDVDWEDVFKRKLIPPIVPDIKYEGDSSNFEEYPEADWRSSRRLEESEIKLFDDF